MNMPKVYSKGHEKLQIVPDYLPPSFPSHSKRVSYQQRQLSGSYPHPQNPLYQLQYSQQMPLHFRSSQKNAHYMQGARSHQGILVQAKTLSEKHRGLSRKSSKRSSKDKYHGARYTEGNHQTPLKSSSDQQRFRGQENYRGIKGFQMGHPPKPRVRAAYLQEEYLLRDPKSTKSRKSGQQRSPPNSLERCSMQSSDKKQVFSRHYKTLEDGDAEQQELQVEISLAKRLQIQQANYCADIGIRNKLEKFSHYLSVGMEKLVQKIESLQSKNNNMDIYIEELKKLVNQKKPQKQPNRGISEARQRQNNFLMNEYESKTRQLKIQNENMQKQLITLRNKEEGNRLRIRELQLKAKQYEGQGTYEQLKRVKTQLQRKISETESRLSRIQKEKAYIQEQFEQFKRRSFQPRLDLYSSRNEDQNLLESTKLENQKMLSEEVDRLSQKISRLQEGNKAYEKLLSSKTTQLETYARSSCENKMMLEKMKEINAQLERQCSNLQKEKMQKEVEVTDKICVLNNNLKKKVKEFDGFKSLMIDCLDRVYKQLSKRVRKTYDLQLTNKNRTQKCQIYLKGIGQYIRLNEENLTIVHSFLQKNYGISASELDRSGYEQTFAKIIGISENERHKIVQLNEIIRDMEYEIKEQAKIREQISPEKQFQLKQEKSLKRIGSNSIKQIPSHDIEPGKYSAFQAQQLNKKKEQVNKLSKEIIKVTEQSHKQYLTYEQTIGKLEIKQKQLISKLAWADEEKKELLTKIAQKQDGIMTIQKQSLNLKDINQSLSSKISQLNMELKKGGVEANSRIQKLEQQLEALRKKMKKMKSQLQAKQKTLNSALSRKDKTIDELMEQKKKNTVQLKVLHERLEFAKIMEQTKQEHNKKIEEELPSVVEEPSVNENSLYLKRLQDLNYQNQMLENEVQNLNKKLKQLISEVNSKDKHISIIENNLKKKQVQFQEVSKSFKEREERRQNVQEEYKKKIEQLKSDYKQKIKSLQEEKRQKNKQLSLLKKQVVEKETALASITDQKTEEVEKVNDFSSKVKDYEQRMSQEKIEREELVRMLNKKENELEEKDQFIEELQEKIKEEEQKQHELSEQLLQRQQYFRKSEELMEQVVSENRHQKQQLQIKQEEISRLIKSQEQLNTKQGKQIESRNEEFQTIKKKYQKELQILKQQYYELQKILQNTKNELKMKNDQISGLKEEKDAAKKEVNESIQGKGSLQEQIEKYLEEIENLKNRIDIMQEESEEAEARLRDRDEELERVKKQKNKYYKILEQKYEYIEQLEEAIKIKVNEVGLLQQKDEDNEQLKEKYEQNQEKLREEVENLTQYISRLEEKYNKEMNDKKQQIEALIEKNSDFQKQMNEMKNRIGVLEKEGRVIKEQYNALVQECQEKNVVLQGASQKVHNTEEVIQKKQKQIRSLSEELHHLKEQLTVKDRNILELEDKSNDLTKQCSNLKEQLNEKSEKYKQILEEKEEIQQNLRKKITQIQNQNCRLKQQLQQKDSKLQQLSTYLKAKQTDIQCAMKQQQKIKLQFSQKLNEKQQRVNEILKQHQSLESDLKQHLELLQKHQKKLTEEISKKNEQISQIVKRNSQIVTMLQLKDQQNVQLMQKCQGLSEQLQQLMVIKSKEVRLQEEQTSLQAHQLEEYKQKYEEAMSEVNSKSQSFDRLKSKYDNLKEELQHDFQEQLEQYKNSITILERQNNTYKETMVIVTLKCQTLQKENGELRQMVENDQKGGEKEKENFILGQSPNSLQFNSVEFDCPHVNILSGEEPYRNFSIVSKVTDIFIEGMQFQPKEAQVLSASKPNQEREEEDAAFVSCQENSKSAVKSAFSGRSNRSGRNQLYIETESVYKSEKRYLDELLKCKAELELTLYAKENMAIQLQQLQRQLRQYEKQVKELVEQQEAEEEQSQRRFMNQSDVFKQQIHREKVRAETCMTNFTSMKKLLEQLMEVIMSKDDRKGDLEDCLDQLQMLCRENDSEIKKKVESYQKWYSELRERQPEKDREKEREQEPKKKRGWF